MNRLSQIIPLSLMASLAFSDTALAREPLPMEGKSTLYQRVLIRQQTPRLNAPGGGQGDILAPLQSLFVYANDGEWMQVGYDDQGTDLFWIASADASSWRQNIVATFEGSADLGRVLFFADEDAVFNAVESENPALTAGMMRDAAQIAEQGGEASEEVVALGPRATPDLRENLYVMPILDSEEAILESNGAFVNVLKVAVARADAPALAGSSTGKIAEAPVGIPDVDREDFRAGVVFVVDTTISMEEYIRGTKAALEEVYREFSNSDIGDAVSFGLVGYRDSLEAAPGLEYDVKTFVNLQDGSSPEAFLAGIDQMTEAKSTSRNFREDSFAAIDHALRDLQWSGFGARYIVLVTDAGPRDADDEYSKTGLTGRALNSLVKERLGAALAVMHLKTPNGANDHDRAEAAYRDLTQTANQASLYFPVNEGNTQDYVEAARKLSGLVVDQVVAFRTGENDRGSGNSILEAAPIQDGDTLTKAVQSAGRTMQLAYLGREGGTQAPDVFEAYVADRDFDRPGLKPLSIRLLLSKSELSDLDESVRLIIRKGEDNVLSADQMFNQVLSAAADMSRRPDQVTRNADTTLADAVSVSEMLEGLPYQSQIMSVTEDDWLRMSISEQQSILSALADKIELYARYNETTDQWVDYLGTGADANALLYPMRLDDLP